MSVVVQLQHPVRPKRVSVASLRNDTGAEEVCSHAANVPELSSNSCATETSVNGGRLWSANG